MGYYTRFELTVRPYEYEERAKAKLEKISGHELFETSVKWYEYETHMTAVSKEIPALLILDGHGEESGDIWRTAWLNGKVVLSWKLDATPPEPSPEILKQVLELEKTAKLNRIEQLEEELKKLKEQAN